MKSTVTRLNRLVGNWLDRWDPIKSAALSIDWLYLYDPTCERIE
jgi:hypothetical protein